MNAIAKFLVVGDVHFKGVNPKARLDNYMEALTAKWYEVFELARTWQVEAIIQTGDLFDSPGTSLGLVAELASILQAAPCPVLAVSGNHDIYGGNAESKRRTPFGLLAKLGIIWDVEEQAFVSEDLASGLPPVVVSGHGFTSETDTETGKKQFDVPVDEYGDDDSQKVNVHVVHSMMLDYAPGFEMRHTLVSEVETSADVVVCGHVHTGFGQSVKSDNNYANRRDDGVVFINPGALCRLSAHQAEIDRTVQVAVLSVEVHGGAFKPVVNVALIPLRSALPGGVVLSREHLEQEQERSGRLEHFLSLLASEGAAKFLEVRDIVEDIAARENLPVAVKDEALKRVGRAREHLGLGV